MAGGSKLQMSALYRINPELLAKHAPEAYKFYKGLDKMTHIDLLNDVQTAKVTKLLNCV